MLRTLLVLIIAGMLGASSPALSWAGSGDAAPLAAAPSMPEGTAPGVTLPSATTSGEKGYLIGPGDVLDISVWKDEALTRSCVVRPDGAISFPLIGDLQAGGRTADQIKAEMEKKLDRYVPGAVLSLEVKQVNSVIIYVIGKVNAPGRFVMTCDVDVLQALATAGGLNIYAKGRKIKIFRQDSKGTAIYPFDYDAVVEGKHLEQNIRLRRGDVVVIP